MVIETSVSKPHCWSIIRAVDCVILPTQIPRLRQSTLQLFLSYRILSAMELRFWEWEISPRRSTSEFPLTTIAKRKKLLILFLTPTLTVSYH